MTVPIPEEAFEAAAMPLAQYMARSDTYDAASDAVRAAAPLIVAAELSDYARDLKAQAEALGEPRIDTPASAIVQVLNTLAGDFAARASVLRGEGQTDAV